MWTSSNIAGRPVWPHIPGLQAALSTLEGLRIAAAESYTSWQTQEYVGCTTYQFPLILVWFAAADEHSSS